MLDLAPTLTLLGLSIAAAVFCGWRGARPWDPRKGPRLIPWRALMLAFGVVVFLMAVHAANLLGVETGRR